MFDHKHRQKLARLDLLDRGLEDREPDDVAVNLGADRVRLDEAGVTPLGVAHGLPKRQETSVGRKRHVLQRLRHVARKELENRTVHVGHSPISGLPQPAGR